MNDRVQFPTPPDLLPNLPPGPQDEYDAMAERYTHAVDVTVQSITEGAHIIGTTEAGDSTEAEVIAWRVDSNVFDDGKLTFATRYRMVARRAGSVMLDRQLISGLHILPWHASRELRPGTGDIVDVYDVSRQDVWLKDHVGPSLSVPMSEARFVHTATGDYVYRANPKEGSEVIVMPAMPTYEEVAAIGYAAFCMSKIEGEPIAEAIRSELFAAKERDRGSSESVDNLALSQVFAERAPSDAREKIRLMVDAVSAYRSGDPLTPALVGVLLDPHTPQVAQMAAANKSLYVKQITYREYTPAIPRQLHCIAAFAPQLQVAVYPRLEADPDGYLHALHDALTPVRTAMTAAEEFQRHITEKTMPFDERYWSVRAV